MANIFLKSHNYLMKKFVCMCCGACCRWAGIVHAREEDFPKIAAHLGISVDELINNYTRLSDDRSELVFADKADGACIFLDNDNKCIINPVKPQQCRTFPYEWTASEDAMKTCKGYWIEE